MSISLDTGLWGWDTPNAGMPPCGDAQCWIWRMANNGANDVLRSRSPRSFLSDPNLDPNQREVGLQQLLQQRTQPRPQGPLVFQYDGGKVPHIGKLDIDGNHQSRRSLEPFSSDRSDHIKSGFSVFRKRIQPRESLTEVRKRWGGGLPSFSCPLPHSFLVWPRS